MTRQEHLGWCKRRALELLNDGDNNQAIVSMLSDLSKHDETRNHVGGLLGASLLFGGFLADYTRIREWIEGFN